MIHLAIKAGSITASGLIPGQSIRLDLDGAIHLIHRHGETSHVHRLTKGEIDADTPSAQADPA